MWCDEVFDALSLPALGPWILIHPILLREGFEQQYAACFLSFMYAQAFGAVCTIGQRTLTTTGSPVASTPSRLRAHPNHTTP